MLLKKRYVKQRRYELRRSMQNYIIGIRFYFMQITLGSFIFYLSTKCWLFGKFWVNNK